MIAHASNSHWRSVYFAWRPAIAQQDGASSHDENLFMRQGAVWAPWEMFFAEEDNAFAQVETFFMRPEGLRV
ncbi:MAG: hypothetical protein EA377_04845 [Phycisphaerales bacterium]|nr:MAG: hypothetical protein EA377_04845 [Phycisphaerales bacterium]